MRYVAVVKYNGANYFGWQKQVDAPTLQHEIEKRLSAIFNTEIIIHASGRTDAKVHAFGQVFHFDGPFFPLRKLKYALNRMLPKDIEILKLNKANENFHARFSATSKIYEYVIALKAKDPFLDNTVLFYPFPFNLKLFNEGAKLFIGTHSFINFTSKSEDEQNFIRTISEFAATKRGSIVKVTIKGSGFMRGQIRVMIGTLIALLESKIDINFIKENLNAKDRYIVNYKVSGSGLYLKKVFYNE